MIGWWRRRRAAREALDAIIVQGEALSFQLDAILRDLRASKRAGNEGSRR